MHMKHGRPLSARIDEEVYEKVKLFAHIYGISLSGFVAGVLNEYVDSKSEEDIRALRGRFLEKGKMKTYKDPSDRKIPLNFALNSELFSKVDEAAHLSLMNRTEFLTSLIIRYLESEEYHELLKVRNNGY